MLRKVMVALVVGIFAVAVMGSITPNADVCNIVWGQICTDAD